jgi:hypothetical protein
MEHSYFNLMLYLFQEDCKQSWSPQHTYDTRQDNTTGLSHTHYRNKRIFSGIY